MASRPWSNARLLGALFVGLFVLAVAYQGLEMLLGPGPVSTPVVIDEPAEPVRAEIRRQGDKQVVIEIGEHLQTKITVNDAAEADFLFACIGEAFEEAFPDSEVNVGHPDGWLVGRQERARIKDQVNTITRTCLDELNLGRRRGD